MAVQLFVSEKSGQVGLQFWGDHWEEIRLEVQMYGGDFKKEAVLDSRGTPHSESWLVPVNSCRFLLKDLNEIEKLRVPQDVEALFQYHEAKRYRVPYHRELFLADSFRGDHQEEGLKKFITWSRHAVFWEMRMGKTPIIAAVLNHLWKYGYTDKLLVLCPPESVYNFDHELELWATFYPGNPDEVYIADTKHREPFQPHHKIVIMTYRFLVAYSDELYKKKNKKTSRKYTKNVVDVSNWGTCRTLVCDESHTLKSSKGRSWKLVKFIKDQFENRYILTGTPSPYEIQDLYTQICFLDETLVPDSYGAFVHHIAFTDSADPHSIGKITGYREKNLKEWLESISHLVSREMSADRIEDHVENYWCEPSPLQKEIYQELVSTDLHRIQEKEGRISATAVSNRFSYYQSILDNPGLLVKNFEEGKLSQITSAKLWGLLQKWTFDQHGKLEMIDTLVARYLDEEHEKKLVIWSGHPDSLEGLKIHLEKQGRTCIVAHGQVEQQEGESPAARSRRLVQEFWESPAQILLASYLTLNSAIGLHNANRAIYLDRPWDWGRYAQSQKRIHMENPVPVIINPMIFRKTLEEEQERRLTDRAIVNNADLYKKDALTTEDLRYIFNGGKKP